MIYFLQLAAANDAAIVVPLGSSSSAQTAASAAPPAKNAGARLSEEFIRIATRVAYHMVSSAGPGGRTAALESAARACGIGTTKMKSGPTNLVGNPNP